MRFEGLVLCSHTRGLAAGIFGCVHENAKRPCINGKAFIVRDLMNELVIDAGEKTNRHSGVIAGGLRFAGFVACFSYHDDAIISPLEFCRRLIMSEKLRTDEISEEEFRRIAGLCSRCGIGRREPGELCELCAQNDAVKLLQINRRNRKAA